MSEVISLDNASVLARDQVILKEIHMVVNTGEFCYLRGDSGSGKSSLIEGLYRLLPMTGSRLQVLGTKIDELNAKTLPAYRRKIGLISDRYPLFVNDTIFKNLDRILSLMEWSVASERERRVNEILDKIGLTSLQGETIKDLPSGLRQKVVIARSVLNKPALILADNPMVFLDVRSSDDVMNLFIDLVREHKTSVLCTVSDDYLINRFPARSYLCADGTITESR